MPLPTTNLTLHVDASDTDNIFTTFQSSGSHTGTPSDGSRVEVWDDEGDGIVDVCLTWIDNVNTQPPTYRVTTPLMELPCLDFDGSGNTLRAFHQVGTPARAISNFITASSFTVLISFYAESITDTDQHFDAHSLWGDSGGFVGISLRDNSGQKQIQCFNWDGNIDSVDFNINEEQSYVIMFRHEDNNIYASLNGGAESNVFSASTTNLTGILSLAKSTVASAFYNGRIGEIAIYNAALGGSNLTDAVSYFTDKWLESVGGGGSIIELACAA